MENKHASLAVVIILSLLAYSITLKNESKALREELVRIDLGYEELMSMKVGGKELHKFVRPESVSVFKVGGNAYACAQLSAPLPVPPHKK